MWGAVYGVHEEPTQPHLYSGHIAETNSVNPDQLVFLSQAPHKNEGVTNDTGAGKLQHFRQQLATKRKMEEEFLPKLQLCGIEPISYKELEWVDQDFACVCLSNRSS